MWELLGSNSLLGTSKVGKEPDLLWGPALVSGFRGTCFLPVGICFTGQLTSWIEGQTVSGRASKRSSQDSKRNTRKVFHTFLFLWHTLTSSTSKVTEFCSFSLSWDGFPETKPQRINQINVAPTASGRGTGHNRGQGQSYQLYGRSQWRWAAGSRPGCERHTMFKFEIFQKVF